MHTTVLFHFYGIDRQLVSQLTTLLKNNAVVLQTLDRAAPPESTVRAEFNYAAFAQLPVMWAMDHRLHIEINPPNQE